MEPVHPCPSLRAAKAGRSPRCRQSADVRLRADPVEQRAIASGRVQVGRARRFDVRKILAGQAGLGCGTGIGVASFPRFWAAAARRNASRAPFGRRNRSRSSFRIGCRSFALGLHRRTLQAPTQPRDLGSRNTGDREAPLCRARAVRPGVMIQTSWIGARGRASILSRRAAALAFGGDEDTRVAAAPCPAPACRPSPVSRPATEPGSAAPWPIRGAETPVRPG